MVDTLSIARKLSGSGVKREQAEVFAEVVADVADQQYADLATKDFVSSQISIVRGEVIELRGDMNAQNSELRGEISELRGDMNTQISELRGDMNTQISELRGGMNAQISALETRLVRWIVATGLVVIGLLVASEIIF